MELSFLSFNMIPIQPFDRSFGQTRLTFMAHVLFVFFYFYLEKVIINKISVLYGKLIKTNIVVINALLKAAPDF